MEKLQITSEGIKKNLNKIKPHIAICEYIWNGLDANANIIKINTKNNEFGGITEISINDNGNGINYNEIKKKISPFNESEKGIGVSFK
ncbi:MAG: ATP-binding protein, partial [Ruminococcus bicirculans (ex Wegman et al. 2014)]